MKRWKQAKANQSGVAMVLMIAVMAVVVALATSILLAASQLNAGADQSIRQEQARISAQTLADVVNDQLTKNGSTVYPKPNESLIGYLYDNMYVFDNGNSWTFYNPDEAGHTDLAGLTRTFSATPGNADMQDRLTMEISMYWESESLLMFWTQANITQKDRLESVILHVTVKCTVDGKESYAVNPAYGIVCGDKPNDVSKAQWVLLRYE